MGSLRLADYTDLDAVAFLQSRELLHLDGHFGNVRADDERRSR